MDAARRLDAAGGAQPHRLDLSVPDRFQRRRPDGRAALDQLAPERRRALDLSRSNRAGLELEPLILANLAEASCDEDMQQALQLAEEARGLAQRRSQRIAELFANSSLIRIQARGTDGVSPASRTEFDRLIGITGASHLRQRVHGLL